MVIRSTTAKGVNRMSNLVPKHAPAYAQYVIVLTVGTEAAEVLVKLCNN